jgi:hypothetical protein
MTPGTAAIVAAASSDGGPDRSDTLGEPMRSAYVHTATLQLGAGTDPAAVGAVTVELCGHWDHEGDCRRPHNNEISVVGIDALCRTVRRAVLGGERGAPTNRQPLRTSVDWSVQASGPPPLEPGGRAHQEACLQPAGGFGAWRRGYSEHVESTSERTELSFERDVKPLFRERDRGAMLSVAKFDLWNRDDVAEHADAILGRLEDGSMPCDESWPKDRIAVVRKWVDAGMPA